MRRAALSSSTNSNESIALLRLFRNTALLLTNLNPKLPHLPAGLPCFTLIPNKSNVLILNQWLLRQPIRIGCGWMDIIIKDNTLNGVHTG